MKTNIYTDNMTVNHYKITHNTFTSIMPFGKHFCRQQTTLFNSGKSLSKTCPKDEFLYITPQPFLTIWIVLQRQNFDKMF